MILDLNAFVCSLAFAYYNWYACSRYTCMHAMWNKCWYIFTRIRCENNKHDSRELNLPPSVTSKQYRSSIGKFGSRTRLRRANHSMKPVALRLGRYTDHIRSTSCKSQNMQIIALPKTQSISHQVIYRHFCWSKPMLPWALTVAFRIPSSGTRNRLSIEILHRQNSVTFEIACKKIDLTVAYLFSRDRLVSRSKIAASTSNNLQFLKFIPQLFPEWQTYSQIHAHSVSSMA